MKQILIGAILLLVVSFSYDQKEDPNITLIQKNFDAFQKDFISRDADALATHFQFP